MGKSSTSCHSEAMYRGVRKRKWGKWVSEIRLPNSRARIWLGSYDTPEKAARAFDAALFCLRGTAANFNFPHTLPHIPEGRSLLPSQIQAAAARYANHVQQQQSDDISSSLSSELESPSPSISVQTDHDLMNNNTLDLMGHLPDFELYPGFDDYFMTTPPVTDYQEDEISTCDAVSYLWNF